MSDDNKEGAAEPVAWQWVPKKATPEMVFAMAKAWQEAVSRDDPNECVAEWNAALLAAPTPPAVMPAAPSAAASPHKPAVQRIMDLARSFRAAPGDLYDRAYKALESEAYADLSQTMQPQAGPIDMVLHCPKCGLQHVDAPEELPMPAPGSMFEGSSGWTNPPHRSHLCHGCGHIWRPADVPTNGVQAVKTTGKADSPISQAEPAAGEQRARNWIHGEAIDYLEVPDVQDESGINAHYSRDLVLQCIDAAIEAGKEQAGAAAYQGPKKFTAEEIAAGNVGIRWITAEAVMGRPSSHDVMEYLKRNAGAMCNCEQCRAFFPALAAPGAAIAAREQDRRNAAGTPFAVEDLKLPLPALPEPFIASTEIGYSLHRAPEVLRFGADCYRAALTQPTTVQQAEPTDEHLDAVMRVCIQIANRYAFVGDAAFPRGREKLRAALKGMQPGEREDGNHSARAAGDGEGKR